MNAASTTPILLSSLLDFGAQAGAILSEVVGVGVALLVFQWGWRQVRLFMTDQSYSIGGYYLRRTPYAGYHRFRSKKWNMEHADI